MRLSFLEFGVNFSIFMSSLLSDVSSFDIYLHSLRSEMFIKSLVLKDYGVSGKGAILGVQDRLMGELGLTNCCKNCIHVKTRKFVIGFSWPIIKHYCVLHEFEIGSPSGVCKDWKRVE
jgi:hypothetical protein